jgi:hypothetical protein
MGPQTVTQAGTPVRLTASGLVKTGAGRINGFFVTAASATPTIKIWNSTTNSGDVILNTFTPVVGWQFSPFLFGVGCYVEISGTVDVTIAYVPG